MGHGVAEDGRQGADQGLGVFGHVDGGQVAVLVELLVNKGHGAHPGFQAGKPFAFGVAVGFLGLDGDQPQDDLQVVFDPVVDLGQEHLFFFQGALQGQGAPGDFGFEVFPVAAVFVQQPGPVQGLFHGVEQHGHVGHGLGDEVPGPQADGLQGVLQQARARNHDGGRVRGGLAQPGQHLHAAKDRHPQVDEHQIGPGRLEDLQALAAVGGLEHPVAVVFQVGGHGFAQDLGVVHGQDDGFGGVGHDLPPLWPRTRCKAAARISRPAAGLAMMSSGPSPAAASSGPGRTPGEPV